MKTEPWPMAESSRPPHWPRMFIRRRGPLSIVRYDHFYMLWRVEIGRRALIAMRDQFVVLRPR